MISLRLLTAINIAHTDNELLDLIDHIANAIEDGNVAVDSDMDLILSLHLTPAGRERLPMAMPRLPTAAD
jgi:hypothetical protein